MRHRLQCSLTQTHAGTHFACVRVFLQNLKEKNIENKINVNFLLWANVKPRTNINCQLQIPDKSAALSSSSSPSLPSPASRLPRLFGVFFKINLYCLILLKADFFLPRLELPCLGQPNLLAIFVAKLTVSAAHFLFPPALVHFSSRECGQKDKGSEITSRLRKARIVARKPATTTAVISTTT